MEIDYVQKKLNKINIHLDAKTIQRLKTRGFMSKIYSCDSNKGNLILHIITPVPEQIRQKIYQKIRIVSDILEKSKKIISAKVYFSGITPKGHYFIVQKLLPGKNLGDRKIKKEEIINRYFRNNDKLIRLLEENLAKLHSIKLSGYGFLQVKNRKAVGQYNSWKEFLYKDSKKWIKNILKNKDGLFKKEFIGIKSQIEKFFKKYDDCLSYRNKGSIIHGDMINPGNVLINKGKISGIIDFEWAAVGDPAWEFAYCSEPIDYYFNYFKAKGKYINQKEFLFKRKLYRALWLLWGISVHAKGGIIKEILYKDFKSSLNDLVKI
jgi:thiamine kinase-like enzyme